MLQMLLPSVSEGGGGVEGLIGTLAFDWEYRVNVWSVSVVTVGGVGSGAHPPARPAALDPLVSTS